MSKTGKPWQDKMNLRKSESRNKRQRILIICEGSKTEPNYFKAFPIDTKKLEVKVIGKGYNTDSLVEEAMRSKQKAIDNKKAYNQVWCVFDKNSFPPHQFNRAIQLATSNNIRVAYSNEAFEIWYLLHFEYFITAMSREQYKGQLEKYLDHKYCKNSETMYSDLDGRQGRAIKNARKLLEEYIPPNPAYNNPSTTVYLLVEQLNQRLKK